MNIDSKQMLSDTFLRLLKECCLDIFQFMRERILPVNVIIVLSVIISLCLDFFAPIGPILAWASYGLTLFILCIVLLELAFPSLVRTLRASRKLRLFNAFQKLWMGESYSWQSPAWQTIAMMTLLILFIGQVSQSRQIEGGILASRFIPIANAQAKFFGLNDRSTFSGSGMSDIDQQLHEFGKTIPYRSAADALSKGSWLGIQQFMQKGEQLPEAIKVYGGSSYARTEIYELAEGLAHYQEGRIKILELYIKNGWDINTTSRIPLIERHLSKLIANTANEWINDHSVDVHPYKPGKVRLDLGRCKVSLLDVAILTKDHQAIAWLLINGSNPDQLRMCVNSTTEFSFTSRQLARVLRVTLK